MRFGMVGLGRMGGNMARRLMRRGHEAVVFDLSTGNVAELVKEGAAGAGSIEELVGLLTPPRVVWIMLPAGRPVDDTITALSGLLSPGDVVVEGGNSFYKDAIGQEKLLSDRGVEFIDAGVSSGIWGLERGYCLMIGGGADAFEKAEPLFSALAPEGGYSLVGPVGAGHFVKMVHNGIEYALMAAYGEGFEILKASEYGDGMDLAGVAGLWNRGSIVQSWLLGFAEAALSKHGSLEDIEGYVADSGEGRWTVKQAVDSGVPAPLISAALYQRFRSQNPEGFAEKLLAAMRNEFGGHEIKKK